MRDIFAWDPAKARENLRNYHISFERAASIFHDSWTLAVFAIAHGHEESRWSMVGRDRNGKRLIIRLSLSEKLV